MADIPKGSSAKDTSDDLFSIFHSEIVIVASWFNAHGWIAWLILVIVVVVMITKPFSEAYDIWVARIAKPIAKTWRFRWAVRAAEKYDVRGHANIALRRIAAQMPKGWISELDIKWVDRETRKQFFENQKLVVHMRPLDDQDFNFVSVVHLFLQETLFSNVRHLIPDLQRAAAVLYFGSRIAEERGASTIETFGERIFEPLVRKKKKIEQYFQRYCKIDESGFFSGTFIREIQHIAQQVRGTKYRDNMAAEMNEVLTHLEEFREGYSKGQSEHVMMPESAWSRNGIASKYGLLLVASPLKAAVDDEGSGYVSRALQRERENVKRLYVFGTADQLAYAIKVMQEIEKKTSYELEQQFELHRDYRGDVGGVGALFVLASV
ncbi:MAG: hypothetical protein IAI50_05700 [Candidatus Eremiobacteraeota bacterium]|nr:hypothetical protein [Candidatus Eremiobacteraeota bacterium]